MVSTFVLTFKCCSTVKKEVNLSRIRMPSSLTWVCWLWHDYFLKTGLIASNTFQVVHVDSFPLPPIAETSSHVIKSYQNRSPTLLIPRTDVKSWIGIHLLFILTQNSIHNFSNLNCDSSLKQEMAFTTTSVLTVLTRTTLWPLNTSSFTWTKILVSAFSWLQGVNL